MGMDLVENDISNLMIVLARTRVTGCYILRFMVIVCGVVENHSLQ